MNELEILASGGAGSRANKMESAHLAADTTISAKRVKTEVSSYLTIKIESNKGGTSASQFVEEKEMKKLEEPALLNKQDPDDPDYDEELDFTYEPPPESFIQSSMCAKKFVSQKHASSRAKGLLNWYDGKIQLQGGLAPKSKVVVSDVLDIHHLCSINNIFTNVSSKVDVASREMFSHFKKKAILEKDLPEFESVRNEPYLRGRKKDMAIEYIRLICLRKIPRDVITAIRIAWQDPIEGEYNTPERAFGSKNGISYTASVNDDNGSRKVVEYCKEKYPTPLSVLTNDPSITMDETKKIREALQNFSYARRVKEIAAEVFATTGQHNLNAKVMVDAALKSVLTNKGEMVTDFVDVMSITNTGYKKASIMMHAWLGVDKAEHIGVDSHMLDNLGAIGLISDKARMSAGCKSDLRAMELESYLPKYEMYVRSAKGTSMEGRSNE